MIRYDNDDKRKAGKSEERKEALIVAFLLIFVCCIVAPIAIIGLLAIIPDTSYKHGAQPFHRLSYKTREISGFTVRDKAGEYYEHQAEVIFTNEGAAVGGVDFSFLWDVTGGFDEDAVIFDDPGVTYDVGPSDEGWRRLTVHCKDFDGDRRLNAKFIYPADALVVRDAPPGYYRWDVDDYTDEEIPALNREMTAFENPYACADWIKEHIKYGTVSDDPQIAAETFRGGKGDCDDIALLFCYMVKRLFPETEPRVVEGWTTKGRYHANALIRTDSGWLMLDPAFSDVKFGVFDFGPFVPSSRISVPFDITDENGFAVTPGGLSASFGKGTVKKM
ncbi:MAG: transglutaminase-like domain-containing protein [Clostridiales Family XIII bacterium]|jgi:hypothetical protein|nr:transglutaminase-like domain-containing protein [Clostridiales Family XIII bacterium]